MFRSDDSSPPGGRMAMHVRRPRCPRGIIGIHHRPPCPSTSGFSPHPSCTLMRTAAMSPKADATLPSWLVASGRRSQRRHEPSLGSNRSTWESGSHTTVADPFALCFTSGIQQDLLAHPRLIVGLVLHQTKVLAQHSGRKAPKSYTIPYMPLLGPADEMSSIPSCRY